MANTPIVRNAFGSYPSAAQRRVERLRLELEAARGTLADAWTGYNNYPTYRAALLATCSEHVRLL